MGALPGSKIIFATRCSNLSIACLQFLTIVIILISAPSLRSDRYGGGIPFLCLGIIFMLEQTINDHTLAVRELTAAVRELTAGVQALVALQQSALPGAPAASATASAPSFSTVPPAAYGPAGASEAAAAVAAADALSGANASCAIVDALPSATSAPANEAPASAPAPVTAEAPAPAPVTQPAPAAPAEPAAPITPEALRALCIRAGQAGHTAYVVDFLRTRGVQMLADLPAKYHAELVESLAAMGVN